MAAEVVGSAVAQEAVTQLVSRFKERHKEKSDAKEHMEKLEMAHIKLEAALETSQRWSVTSAPLLRWRSKLKRAAQECDHTLRRCRQRLREEEEEAQREVRISSFPQRIAHAARSLASSIFDRGSDEDDELRGPTVRRFEWFAEGAGEFLRYVELGGTPRRRYIFFDALVRHLLAGEGIKRCFVHGGQHLSFLLQPFSPPEHGNGMEGVLVILLEDGNVPENNFTLSVSLRLSESTDLVGVVVRCLQLFAAPLLLRSSVAEAVKTKLTQLPTQDLCWVPDAYSVSVSYGRIEHQDDVYTVSSKWFRPNPLCCQGQDHHHYVYAQSYAAGSSTSPSEPSPYDADGYLEAVSQVHLLGHVAVSGWSNRQRGGFPPYLKLGVHFCPHASCEDLSPAVGGSATEVIINAEATATATATQRQRGLLYSNICFQELLDEILLQKAEHYLCGASAAAAYQMLWRSRHGRADLQVERASWPWTATTRKGTGERRQKRRRPGKKVQAWTSGIGEFMSSWIAHAPAQLQALAVDWIQKQEQSLQPLFLKTNPCVHDCPIMLVSLQYLRSLAQKIKSFSTFLA